MNIEIGPGSNPVNENTPHISNRKIHFTIDISKHSLPSMVGKSTYLPFKTESIDVFVSQHLVEHHSHKTFDRSKDDPEYGGDVVKHLREIHRCLKHRGHYECMMPNLAFIAQAYVSMLVSGRYNFEQALQFMSWISGGQRNEYDYHYVCMDFGILSHFANLAGFKKCELLHDFSFFGLHVKMTKE